ncbi:DUF4241 domain-containing protein [Paenibacillus macquariensis]|uniref:DUF4241 domain-containing protein n=1 Tax=Paenibacillus macquariensis TaxID=948756 RepID=A0ABY1KCY3_9BACL|nr:DUF4241 domain-containing protein [Paenibacillus macquariensis]MEC0093198.1 DUF4241 domain-containing protein [Paenibacillus macquariensis]OAB35057.1 hypothetical protein PMSM_10755 [Paenibacillus macquariensis subsp. macquariensis]SIR62692.1 Protein of unknown function [Paenibacillus macquariensis]
MNNIQLGNFELTSGQIVVSDPCYELNRDTIIMGVLDNVLNGTWVAQVGKTEVRDWGEACSKLTAFHSSVAEQVEHLEWVKCSFIVGVDSGQAGIFDINKYRIPDSDVQETDTDTDSDWYLSCCDITESGHEAGVLDGGVVSHTGMGDGTYGAYTATNNDNQVIAVKIIFIKGSEF